MELSYRFVCVNNLVIEYVDFGSSSRWMRLRMVVCLPLIRLSGTLLWEDLTDSNI